MSTASKVVLGVSVALTVGTVAGVHIKQNWERQRLREGVVRDLERVQRKLDNQRALEEQIHLTRELVAHQEAAEAAGSRQGSL
ncbi:protein PET117 homolog, mitochondrial [Clarias gariepinus]|uniref:protein PET117 homolog, mitochondrial n=1 Tax=Clarias gariepinus TaxID=13013 RepID=UPI00234C9F02|nr:protein PET117 homolog, mitochondrial [Clarias gariepinus]